MSSDQTEPMGVSDTPNDSVSIEGDTVNEYYSVLSTSDEPNMSFSKDSENSSLLKAIETMFDAKFNILEQRLNEVIQKNEIFTSDITRLIKNKHYTSPVVEPTDVKFNDGGMKEDIERKISENEIVIPKDFVDSVEQKLSQIFQ